MIHKLKFYTLLFSVLLSILAISCKNNHSTDPDAKNNPYVVMLSLDGFRWDYPQKANTPNLDRIAEIGVRAESLRPCFPTKTFPNHYSIATGLYPGNHGIVLNNFYDSAMDVSYSLGNRESVENGDFYGGEPIWVTAENQGVITASYFWVGSEAPVKGVQPTYWKRYEHKFPFTQRVDSVIAWLSLPEEKRPHLITWYMDEPDSKGHQLGPDNPDLIPVISYLDSLVGNFMFKLNRLEIGKNVNFIVISDHG
ncbi:MAG: alkaline phosphatase family protein, partial [Bacteroidetes bacterium]|nr:alkaline phosphatase family protein [Bacteroidota bacterium]